jgi:hypothetical protein
MALTDYKAQFDNAYQEVFQKTLVAKEIMNTRFERVLSYGASVTRVAFDISAVQVRTVTRGSASTIDTVLDTPETLTINLEKEAVFHISDGEATQTGPLNPGEEIGKQVARKVAVDLDGRCFAEVRNALYDFDTGDLTTASSNATPITLSSTTVPQMVTRLAAKLRRVNNQDTMTNMALVVDSYAAGDIAQYMLGKSIDLAATIFQNGRVPDAPVAGGRLYVSENLQGEAVLSIATTPTDADTVTINGVVFTFKTTLGVTAGNVAIAGSADAARLNLSELINAPGTTDAGQVALSAANQLLMANIVATDDAAANTMTIVGTGTGRFTLSETLTDATDAWTKNFIHAYYGKRGAIDLVIQDLKEVDMRKTDDRRGTNVFSSYLAGIKTFADGAKKFLDVLIAA